MFYRNKRRAFSNSKRCLKEEFLETLKGKIITTKDDKKLALQSLPFFINKNFNINDKFLSSFDEFVSFQDER